MEQIKIFSYEEKEVRTVTINNDPWWIASDICEVLSLSNPTMALSNLDEDERSKFNLGRQGEANIVNEAGLYSLILGSRKPEAKQFKRWITHEVLPSIRKHGMYATDNTIESMLNDPDTMIKTLQALKDERQARLAAENTVSEMKPKAIFADAVSVASTSILIGDLAKLLKQNGINTGANRLFEWLRNNGYLIKRKGSDYNSPTQQSMNLGLIEVKETIISHGDGHTSISKTPKITGKGQVYFINKFLGKDGEKNA